MSTIDPTLVENENSKDESNDPKKLSKGQKKRLQQKRKYKRDRMKQTANHILDSKLNFNQKPGQSKSEKEKFHKDNADKTGFEKVIGSSMKKPKQFNKNVWYKKVPLDKREEWLIDCYRMRVDDDNRWGGGYMHGLAEVTCDESGAYGKDIKGPKMKKLVIIKDFIKFIILCVENKCFPLDKNEFNLEKMLKLSPNLINKYFTKKCAKEKYGIEDVFDAKPSLRRQAEYIYKTSIMQDHNIGKEEELNYHEQLEDKIEVAINEKKFENSDNCIFEKIGGKDIWVDIFNKMDVSQVYNRNDTDEEKMKAQDYPDAAWSNIERHIPDRLPKQTMAELEKCVQQ